MQEDLDLAIKRIAELERKIERYYQLLHIDDELDFILNGTYTAPVEIDSVVDGTYEIENSTNQEENTDADNN